MQEPVDIIRVSTRKLLKLSRQIQKNEECDARRSLDNKCVTPEQIADIGNRLKSKSQVSLSELNILKNALIDNKENIEIILKSQGALKGIVREVSGKDIRRQCTAAGCCCNLALGDSRSCMAVAKAAGPYLIAALNNLTTELAVTCAWALGNIAGSGPRPCELLVAQGAVTKLADLLPSNDDLRDAALYALVHLAYQLKDSLRVDYLNKILDELLKLDTSLASSQLLFILSCHDHFENNQLPEAYLQNILEKTFVSTKQHVSACKSNVLCCELVYVLRTLANVTKEAYSLRIINFFVNENINIYFCDILKSDNRILKESLLWLLGVLNKYAADNDYFSIKMSIL